MWRRIICGAALMLGSAGGARASELLTGTDPYTLCDAAIGRAERSHALPPGLLGAIGRVESGRRDPISGALRPWPWTIDVEGEGHLYETESEAIAAVREFQALGRRSIDVGCMQVNLVQHPDAFDGLGAAFDPVTNAQYAADLLTRLRQGSADWLAAAGLYHSATPALGLPYQLKVEAALQQSGVPTLPMAPAMGMRVAMGSALPMAMPVAPAGGTVGGGMVGGFFHRAMQTATGAAGAGLAANLPTGRGLAFYRAMPVRRRVG